MTHRHTSGLGPSFLEAAAASTLVKNWRPAHRGGIVELSPKAGATHKVEFHNIGHSISVSFTEVKDRPDVMIVRSTNWRYEDEPTGVFDIDECRAFYITLVRNGFTAF